MTREEILLQAISVPTDVSELVPRKRKEIILKNLATGGKDPTLAAQVAQIVPKTQEEYLLLQVPIGGTTPPGDSEGSSSELMEFADNVYINTDDAEIQIEEIIPLADSLTSQITLVSTNGKDPTDPAYLEVTQDITLPTYPGTSDVGKNYIHRVGDTMYMRQEGEVKGDYTMGPSRYETPGITTCYGVQVGQKVYFGGDKLLVHDIPTGTCLVADQLPQPYTFNRTGIIVHDGWLYTIGHADLTGAYGKQFNRINLVTKEIERLTDLPTALDGSGGVGVGDYIYIIGSRSGTTVYRYCISTKEFEQLANCLSSGYNITGVYYQGCIYCASPVYKSSNTTRIQCYNIAANSWYTIGYTTSYGFIGGIVGEYLYYMKSGSGIFRVHLITGITEQLSTTSWSYSSNTEVFFAVYQQYMQLIGNNYTAGHIIYSVNIKGLTPLATPVEHPLEFTGRIKSFPNLTKLYVKDLPCKVTVSKIK